MAENTLKSTEHYLRLFENAIAKHKEIVGEDLALKQARESGLTVSPEGHIVACDAHPMLVLLRLIKVLTTNRQIASLAECLPLIDEMERIKGMVAPLPVVPKDN